MDWKQWWRYNTKIENTGNKMLNIKTIHFDHSYSDTTRKYIHDTNFTSDMNSYLFSVGLWIKNKFLCNFLSRNRGTYSTPCLSAITFM